MRMVDLVVGAHESNLLRCHSCGVRSLWMVLGNVGLVLHDGNRHTDNIVVVLYHCRGSLDEMTTTGTWTLVVDKDRCFFIHQIGIVPGI